MDIQRTIAGMRRAREGWRGSVGFVPTMGYLHRGHLELVRRAREENEITVVSIFVNPAQFGPGEDYERYPRDEPRDLQLLAEAGVDCAFIPSAEEMYPAGFSSWVEVSGPLATRLEGERRQGHFRGVATVVAKLLNITQPHRAYFGEKDYQQFLVVRQMVHDLNLPVEIVPAPTVRDEDGLALSSRNTYLSREERRQALALPQTLMLLQKLVQEQGLRDVTKLRPWLETTLRRRSGMEIEYFSIADAETLEELRIVDRPARALAAVRVGRTRLIDNVKLEP